MREFDVDRMQAPDEPAVIAALARAFYDDPLFGFFVPNLMKQSKALIAFMKSGVKDANPFGDVWVAHADGKVASVAVWLPPGTYPRTPRRELMTYVRTLPTFVQCGQADRPLDRAARRGRQGTPRAARTALLPRDPRQRPAVPTLGRRHRGARARARTVRRRRSPRLSGNAEGSEHRVLRAPPLRSGPEDRGQGLPADLDPPPRPQ